MKQHTKLITKYLPANYTDSFIETISNRPHLSAKELFDLIFLQYPKWIQFLMRLRDLIVKPLGLKTNKSFEKMIIEQNENEIICGATDKHLTFYVSIFCSKAENNIQHVSITTLVKYKNILGRIYFTIIWIFHKTIVYHLLKSAVKRWNNKNKTEHI